MDRPDGSVARDCLRLYTGGTLFRVCYTNSAEGSTCICSSELCNGGAAGGRRGAAAADMLAAAAAAAVLVPLLQRRRAL